MAHLHTSYYRLPNINPCDMAHPHITLSTNKHRALRHDTSLQILMTNPDRSLRPGTSPHITLWTIRIKPWEMTYLYTYCRWISTNSYDLAYHTKPSTTQHRTSTHQIIDHITQGRNTWHIISYHTVDHSTQCLNTWNISTLSITNTNHWDRTHIYTIRSYTNTDTRERAHFHITHSRSPVQALEI